MGKLVAVTINNITKFVRLFPGADGKYRISEYFVMRAWGIKRGEAIIIG